MIRRSLVSALILLYSLATIGMPLHFHYCRGELKHVTLLVKLECHVPQQAIAGHACCKAAMPTCESKHRLNNCCDDSTQWIQDEIPALCPKHADFEDVSAPTITYPKYDDTERLLNISTPSVDYRSARPQSLYLLQCAFIFYG
jgi:hypothetical protein